MSGKGFDSVIFLTLLKRVSDKKCTLYYIIIKLFYLTYDLTTLQIFDWKFDL